MNRFLVLFAREPARQAREKGLHSPAAEGLFREFARGWARAARQTGARLVVATPAEDRRAWERSLAGVPNPGWMIQRGPSLGARLEDVARKAAALGGRAVLVGGDVSPSPTALLEAFRDLEGGCDAAISPAPDGGVSLLAVCPEDADLLRGIRPRRRTLLSDLLRALRLRGRRVSLVTPASDLDGRSALRRFARGRSVPSLLVELARRALTRPRPFRRSTAFLIPRVFFGSPALRGPPSPA